MLDRHERLPPTFLDSGFVWRMVSFLKSTPSSFAQHGTLRLSLSHSIFTSENEAHGIISSHGQDSCNASYGLRVPFWFIQPPR
jgi:hypothetical protein